MLDIFETGMYNYRKERRSDMEKIRIMTFNTQHCASLESGKIDFELMARVIR